MGLLMKSKKILLAIVLLILISIGAVILYYYFIKKPTEGAQLGELVIEQKINELLKDKPATIKVKSPAFNYGERIPDKYTCEGLDQSPPIMIENVPSNVKSLVLIVYDPDAPKGVFYHWILYNIPSNLTFLPENIPKTPTTVYGSQGVNDFGKIGYNGPCPPPGHGTHRYYFLVIALDETINIEPGSELDEVLENIKNHVLAYGYTMGTYSR